MISLIRAEIEALIDEQAAASAIEDAYRAVSLGRVNLPPVGHITFPDYAGDCHIKYGHVLGQPVFVIKVATGFPGNQELGLPNGNGLSLVLSAQTGEAKAVLKDEMVMTDIRTGLGGAIASRMFARKKSRRVLIAGTGIQARRQIAAHLALMGNHLQIEIWGRSAEKAASLASQFSQTIQASVAHDLKTACQKADIIVTATGSTSPFIERAWIAPGTHITAVGADAPGKQELETALVTEADGLFTDLRSQCLDHGEFATAAALGLIGERSVTDIGEVLINPALGRQSTGAITIADLTGLAAQDIAMANLVLSAHQALV